MLSTAVNVIMEFGEEINFGYCKRIAIIDDNAGVIGTGELRPRLGGYGSANGTTNATSTS